MNRNQIAALLIAMLIGVLLASFFITQYNSKQVELLKKRQEKVLQEQIKNSERTIKELAKQIKVTDSLNLIDSVTIKSLLSKVSSQEQHIKFLRTEAKNFTPEQQDEWLVKRYNSSDSIPYKVIDELITKDGLDYKVHVQDSAIAIYMHKDSVQTRALNLIKAQVKEYESITSHLKTINTSLVEDRKELKKQLRKEKIKKGLYKGLVAVEAAAIVILIL